MRHVFTWYPALFCLSPTSQADRARVAPVSQTAKPTGYNTNVTVFEKNMEAFAPVVARLTGKSSP
jgi:hypothetical protein